MLGTKYFGEMPVTTEEAEKQDYDGLSH